MPAGARRIGAWVVVALGVGWLFVAVVLVAILGLEWLTLTDLGCAVPGLESTYGEVSWQVWPPGEVCTFAGARFVEPPASRGVLLVGIGLLAVWRRYRDAPDPDWND